MEQREQQERQQERENVLIEGVHCTCPKRHEIVCSALHTYWTSAPFFRERLRLHGTPGLGTSSMGD